MSARSQISSSQARGLQSNPGFYLRPDSADAWDRAVQAFGKKVLITGALRSYETQARLFTERYQVQWVGGGPYGDVRWWKGKRYVRKFGTAAAAVPGTSNHGSGDAVDVKTRRDDDDPPHSEAVVFTSWNDRDRVEFLKVAAKHGWADDEGRRVDELWHLTYYPDRDKGKNASPAPSTNTDPDTTEEWFDMAKFKRTHTAKALTLPEGTWKTLPINAKGHTSILRGPKGLWDALVRLHLTGLADGAVVSVRFVAVLYGGGKKSRIRNAFPSVEVIGTKGGTFAQVAMRGQLADDEGGQQTRLRIQVRAFQPGVKVESVESRIIHR